MIWAPHFAEICRLLIAIVLLFAAISKLFTFTQFKENLVESFHFPNNLSSIIAILVIAIESLLSILILANGSWTYLAMQMAFILLSAFSILIIWVLVKDKVISCNCFGSATTPISMLDLVRNMVFIAASYCYLIISPISEISFSYYPVLIALALILFQLSTHLADTLLLIQFKDRGNS